MGGIRKGFTLIELLIVVAIIAILAAIAVPNFLEAQTRAKISRELADQRSVAIGLESYLVDNNHYPGSASWTGGTSTLRTLWSQIYDTPQGRFGHLTTPIAYLTSLPPDVFNDFTTKSPGNDPMLYDKAGFGFESTGAFPNGPFAQKLSSGPDGVGFTISMPSDWATAGYTSSDNQIQTTTTRDEGKTPTRWVLWSVGPSKIVTMPPPMTGGSTRYSIFSRYDPTNGTISFGYIMRYQDGKIFPGK